MIEILQFIITIGVCYQVTSIISESSFPIFRWLQKRDGIIGEFFSCFFCVSVWIGCMCGYLLFDLAKCVEFKDLTWLISGLFYSFIVWFIHLFEGKLS